MCRKREGFNICDELDKKLPEDSITAKQFRNQYEWTESACKRHKNSYFRGQRLSAGLMLVSSMFNAVIAAVSNNASCSSFVALLSLISVTLTLIATYMVTQINFRKHFETWQRHSSFLQTLELLAVEFLQIREREGMGEQDKNLEDFENKLNEAVRNDVKQFRINMGKFDSVIKPEGNH